MTQKVDQESCAQRAFVAGHRLPTILSDSFRKAKCLLPLCQVRDWHREGVGPMSPLLWLRNGVCGPET